MQHQEGRTLRYLNYANACFEEREKVENINLMTYSNREIPLRRVRNPPHMASCAVLIK